VDRIEFGYFIVVLVLSFSLLQVEAVLFDPAGTKPDQRSVVSLLERHRGCFAEMLTFYKEIEQIYQAEKKKLKKGSKKGKGDHDDQPPLKQRKASGKASGRGKGDHNDQPPLKQRKGRGKGKGRGKAIEDVPGSE
jgi:hypothetical protein